MVVVCRAMEKGGPKLDTGRPYQPPLGGKRHNLKNAFFPTAFPSAGLAFQQRDRFDPSASSLTKFHFVQPLGINYGFLEGKRICVSLKEQGLV